MNARLWLCASVALSSANASACPKCECISELRALPAAVEPQDVALNARVITGTVPEASRKERFVLRPVGGEPVAVKAEKLHVDTYDTLVLTPTTPLANNTDYELVMLRGKNTVPYSKFHTASATDTTVPTWEGSLAAEFLAADSCDTECRWRRGPRVVITAPVPSDDRSGVELVAVWVTAGTPIDYARPATGHVNVLSDDSGDFAIGMGAAAPAHVTIVLGGPGPCTEQSVPLPRGAKRVRIGMKVIDRAGNASAPRELQLQLRVAATKSRP